MDIPRNKPVGTFTDFTENANDTGRDESAAIQPATSGEPVSALDDTKSLRRPAENLRQRTELLRGLMDETLYLRDADRAFGVFASDPALTVTWNGTVAGGGGGDGKFSISHNLWLLPFNSVGSSGSTPPVGRSAGKAQLLRTDNVPIIQIASNKASWEGGDRYSVTCVAGAVTGAVLTGYNLIVTTPLAGATRLDVINAINAAAAGALTASSIGGGPGDLVKTVQAKQYLVGNWDSEAHVITNAHLSTFFGVAGNDLREGDSLCVWFASLIENGGTGGRRQSLPEIGNTTVQPGSLFNSRVNPERLPNAVPVCKVIKNQLVFTNGNAFVKGQPATLYGVQSADLVYPGGVAWATGGAHPATTVKGELDKIVTDLGGAGGADRIGNTPAGTVSAVTVQGAINELDSEKGGLALPNAWQTTQYLNGAAANGVAYRTTAGRSMSYPVTGAQRKLVDEFKTSTNGYVRIYVASPDAHEVACNCWWDEAGSVWRRNAPYGDSGSLSSLVVTNPGGVLFFRREVGGNPFWLDARNGDPRGWSANTRWVLTRALVGLLGNHEFTWLDNHDNEQLGLTVSPQPVQRNLDAYGGAPAAGTYTNKLYPTNTCKAWGRFRVNGGTVTYVDGYNFSSVAINPGGAGNFVLRVNFVENIIETAQPANYMVHVSTCNVSNGKYASFPADMTYAAGYFEASMINLDVTSPNYAAGTGGGNADIHFVVYGRQEAGDIGP